MNNPLLQPAALPEFSKITPEIIQPAIEQLIDENRNQIKQLTGQSQVDWDSLIKPLSLISDRLSKAWSPVRHLNSVKSSDALRDAYNTCLPVLSEYSTEISQNRKLFEAYRAIADSAEFDAFDLAQQKAINDSLLHFRLGGVELEGESRKRYQEIQKELSGLQSKFENNLLDATQAWDYCSENADEFAGLPEYALALLQQLAQQKDKPGYRVTLDMPCYLAVITYAENRALRQQIYEAYVTRASDIGITEKVWDNADIMRDIVSKRHEKAKLLGFDSYADYSVQTKMASSVDEVIAFLTDLAHKSREAALSEVEEIRVFAREQGFEAELQAWDYTFYSEKLKQHRYQISDEDLKPYFAADRVISGLF
ncbi:MAG: M3 family metallopeptidase, partial [Pseudomonadota bacterium]